MKENFNITKVKMNENRQSNELDDDVSSQKTSLDRTETKLRKDKNRTEKAILKSVQISLEEIDDANNNSVNSTVYNVKSRDDSSIQSSEEKDVVDSEMIS